MRFDSWAGSALKNAAISIAFVYTSLSPVHAQGKYQCEIDGLGFCGDSVETIYKDGKCSINNGPSFDCKATIYYYTWSGKFRGSYIKKVERNGTDETWNTDLGIMNKRDSGCAKGPAISGKWNRKFSIEFLNDAAKLPKGNVTDKDGNVVEVSTLYFTLLDVPCRGYQVN